MTRHISITAEALALMRYLDKNDKYSEHFITKRINRLFNILNKILPRKLIENIIRKRIYLDKRIEGIIKKKNPSTIIEIASGYSTKGLNFTEKNDKLTYIELDLKEVIENKSRILMENNIKRDNLILISKDVINQDLSKDIIKNIKKRGEVVIFSEGFNNYLSRKEHDKLTLNIHKLLTQVDGIYISHDVLTTNRNNMFIGKIGRIISILHRIRTKSSANKHFSSEKECIKYFNEKGFSKCKIIKDRYFFIYEVRK